RAQAGKELKVGQPLGRVVGVNELDRAGVTGFGAGIFLPLVVVINPVFVRIRRAGVQTARSPTHIIGTGVQIQHDIQTGVGTGFDGSLQSRKSAFDALRLGVFQVGALALGIVVVEGLGGNRNTDAV